MVVSPFGPTIRMVGVVVAGGMSGLVAQSQYGIRNLSAAA